MSDKQDPAPKLETIKCRPYNWAIKVVDGVEEIHIWCHDRESKTVLVRVRGYAVPCVIELIAPSGTYIRSWESQTLQRHILERLTDTVNASLRKDNRKGVKFGSAHPITGSFTEATSLYFAQKRDVFAARCPSTDHLRALENKARWGIHIDPTGANVPWNPKVKIDYNVMEGSKIDTIVKYIVDRGITHTQWIEVPKNPPKNRQAIGPFGAEFDHEYVVRPHELVGVQEDTANWKIHPKVFMFDFETYSHVHKNLPDSDWIVDAITDISITLYRDGDRDGAITGERLKEYAFVFGDSSEKICAFDECNLRPDFNTEGQLRGKYCKHHADDGMVDVSGRRCEHRDKHNDCHNLPVYSPKGEVRARFCEEHKDEYDNMVNVTELEEGVEVQRFSSEKAMLKRFVNFIVECDPTVFSGYNISGYDWNYLYARMKKLGVSWPKGASRLKDGEVWYNDKIPIKISPKLTRNLMNLEFDGRVTLDVYHMAIREYSYLPQQNLNTVGRKILNRGKHDVSPEEMFKAHEKLLNVAEVFARITKSWRPMTEDDKPLFSSHYGLYPVFHENIPQKIIDVVIKGYEDAKKEKDRVSYYCDEDTRLCVDIGEKSSMISNIFELSGIVGVQPRDVYTRGEQLRGLTLIYRECKKMGIIVDRQIIQGLKGAAGGHVGKMVPGYYKNVITLDFKSMYPSIIMGYNICYSTYVRPEDAHLWTDDQCNIIEWDQQVVEETYTVGQDGMKRRKKTKMFNEDGTPMMEHHRYRFVKAKYRQGIIPKIVEMLVNERNAVRAKIKTFKDVLLKQIYNIRQMGLKVAGNSMYGLMGVGENGKLPFKIGSMCTAAKGRELIMECNRIIEEECNGTIVYNDTDSTMFQIKGVTTGADMIMVGKLLEKYISDRFPDPLYFEFEKCGDFLGFTAKKYVYWLTDIYKTLPNGKPNPEYGFLGDLSNPGASLLLRGNVLVRRDNPDLLKDIYMDDLRNLLVDSAMIYSEKSDAERIWKHILPYAHKIGIDTSINRIPQKVGDKKVMLQASMHRVMDSVCNTVVDLVTANIDLRKLVITGGINDNYASETAKMNLYFERLREMGKQVSRGDRVAFMVVERPGLDKLGDRMYPVDVFCEMHEKDPLSSPDVFYYINNVLAGPIEQLVTVGYREILLEEEMLFQRSLYSDMHRKAVELLQQGKRVFYTEEEARKIVYGNIPDAVDEEGNITDIEAAQSNIASLVKSDVARIKTQVSAARRDLLTGRDVFNMNMSMNPIEKLAKAYKKDRDVRIRGEKTYFHDYLGVLCSNDTREKLYKKLNAPRGNWMIDQVLAAEV